MTLALRPVKPAEIQAELNRIWESLETTKTTRACLFNLIFCTQKSERLTYFQKIAQRVVQKFPGRVIFISNENDSASDYLKTEVSILSSSQGENDVACDFIQLEAGGASIERLPFVVLPHLISDLPVYLIWAEDPVVETPLFQQLAKFADRVIFDSEATQNLPSFANSLELFRKTSGSDVADLNWARIETWRDMLSSAFYTKERFEKIEQAQQIRITYNSEASQFFCHTRIQTFYLQAWLASQLNWKLNKISHTKELITLNYQSEKQEIVVQLTPVSYPQLPPGLILSLEIQTASQDHFLFQRNLESIHQVAMTYSNPNHCDIPCHFVSAKAETGHSLVKEICHRGTSSHFLNVLERIKQMDTQGLC